MSILKVEAFSGLSGDMFLGALTELTNGYDELKELPALLNLEKVEVKITKVEKAGIACKHIKILDHNSYDDHKHIHAHKHAESSDPKLANLSLASDHTHSHSHHRHLNEIEKIIDESQLSVCAKEIAKDIFYLLGKAESKVHGVDIEKIHFHEVGAIDSILDIVGSAYL